MFSPNERRVYSTGFDGRLRIWELLGGRELLALQVGGAGGVAVSPDGRRLATNGTQGTVTFWDATPLSLDEERWRPIGTVEEAVWACPEARI